MSASLSPSKLAALSEQSGAAADLSHGSLVRTVKKYLSKTKSQELLLRSATLVAIYLLAFSIRLFSVLRYESVIHEFDPYFNYRTTIKLVTEGAYEFWNWFDSETWYPLGRVVGGTVYPGLMTTAASMYHVLQFLTARVKLRDVCVFTAPFFAGNTAMVAYLFGKLLNGPGTGLVAAALMAIVPGYISRSVAGSYDNEAVAIFALVTTFYLWVRAVHLGTISAAVWCAFAYLYMGASWGAYVFISNLIPLYVCAMIGIGRYTRRLYLAYTTLWVVGSILAMQIRFIGFNHIVSTELLAWNGVFVGLQVLELVSFLRSKMPAKLFMQLVKLFLYSVPIVGAAAVLVLILAGRINPFGGRFLTLLDPTYAKKFIPIVASVSEHQPTTWASYIFDTHLLVFAAPAGMYYCFRQLTDENVFLLTFALTAIYFSGIMVRLMLVAAPAFVLLGAIAISNLLKSYCGDLRTEEAVAEAAAAAPAAAAKGSKSKSAKKGSGETLEYQKQTAYAMLAMIFLGLSAYNNHSRWVTSEAYSSPSIVLISGWGPHRHVLDDFREAYYWLRHNTAPDAKIMSWWDYGYQITAMGNRTVIVDNNTWNNTHIATVGRAMASNESAAFEVERMLDVDYVLVVFGGLSGYSSDDINKFLWMIRISSGVFPNHVQESKFLSNGEYTVSSKATPTMVNSLMYKLCYHNFGNVVTQHGQPPGYDAVRQSEIGSKNFELEHHEEAFTSEHWIVRIYRVKPQDNRW